jgi:UDP-N-acetylglucosamine 2-epimerase (non-hydrolysing)
MKKVLVVFGTRPEVIKMAPVVRAIEASSRLTAVTCTTAQHRDLLDQVLQFFDLKPDYDLNLMKPNQDLTDITVNCLGALREIYQSVKPDVVLVQGDTTTTMAAALAAFYARTKVGHVEAGLRTRQKYAPFPEEMNRQIVTPLADFHFAPTPQAIENLRAESTPRDSLYLTGNTSIDALLWAKDHVGDLEPLIRRYQGKKLILMTAHRRENFGAPFREIFFAVKEFMQENPDFHIVYPVHPNPNVKNLANDILFGLPNVSLVPPVSYPELIGLMKDCHLVLTDSGGLQEEAPTLGKPVLVLRETTERPEAVEAGCARLVGHDREKILSHLEQLKSTSSPLYLSMAQAQNPFGDGTASKKIVEVLENKL